MTNQANIFVQKIILGIPFVQIYVLDFRSLLNLQCVLFNIVVKTQVQFIQIKDIKVICTKNE